MWEKTCLLLLIFFLGAAQKPFAQGKNIHNGFIKVSPQDIKWLQIQQFQEDNFAIFLVDPSRFGPLVIRRRFHADARINPHTHLARTYTVLEGEWALGFGERFDLAPLRRFPAVTIYRLPPGVPHFQVTGPHGAVVQIETYGPTRRISSSTIMRVGKRLRD